MLNTEYILSNCNLSEIVKMSPLFFIDLLNIKLKCSSLLFSTTQETLNWS